MAKKNKVTDHIEASGVVTKILSNGFYEVTIDNGAKVVCRMGGKMVMHHIKLLVDDKVDIEISSYDLGRGRIRYRWK